MNDLAQNKNDIHRPQLTCARVVAAHGRRLTLEEDDLSYEARQAASCLVAPAEGDEVLVAHTGEGRAHVLAVLEQQQEGEVKVSFDGDVELDAPGGHMRLSARDGLSLTSPTGLQIATAALELTAATGQVVVNSLTVAGHTARAGWDQVRVAARSSEAVVDRVVQSFKTRLCRVAALDLQRSSNYQQQVDGVYSLGARQALVRAREQVQIDGEQIIMS